MDKGASASQTGPSQVEPVPVSPLRASVPSEVIENWNNTKCRITSYAPSHRQFRLSSELTEEQITAALGGIEPKRRPGSDGKVTVEWAFFAEKSYHNGTDICSVSTCCKIWDYYGSRWSAYGFPEAFEQIGLEPRMVSEGGYEEDGNPTLSILTSYAQGIEARRAETQGGSVHKSAVAESDAP